MPMVAGKYQHSLCHSPNTKLQLEPDRIITKSQQNCKKQKLTDVSGEKDVTKKEIIPKQFIRQITDTRAELKPGNTKNNSPHFGKEEIICRELEYSFLNGRDISKPQDYQVYQNGDVNKFFEKDTLEPAKNIADICLVNDNFILVKMTEPEVRLMNNNKSSSETATRWHGLRNLKNRKESNKICRYLRSKKSRITKIAPIHEEPEDLSDNERAAESKTNCMKIYSCWEANELEVETFQTQTRIYKNRKISPINHHKVLKQSSSSQPIVKKSAQLEFNETPDISTISSSLIESSPQTKVHLHPFGSVLESQKNQENTFKNLEAINKTRRRKCPRLEIFYWLLRPFRGKCRKTEPRIDAVVYKTYFVKWTKPPDNDYGLKISKSPRMEKSVLRRCRSAVF